MHAPSSTIRLLGLGLVLLGVASTARAQSTPAGLSPDISRIVNNPSLASPAAVMAALAAEQQFLAGVTAVAATGDAATAWKLLTADLTSGLSSERLGWRVATVAGFLKNESQNVSADRFARFALAQSWCQQQPSDGVRYWCALIANADLSDRTLALQWLGAQKNGEASSLTAFRNKLMSASGAFPGHG